MWREIPTHFGLPEAICVEWMQEKPSLFIPVSSLCLYLLWRNVSVIQLYKTSDQETGLGIQVLRIRIVLCKKFLSRSWRSMVPLAVDGLGQGLGLLLEWDQMPGKGHSVPVLRGWSSPEGPLSSLQTGCSMQRGESPLGSLSWGSRT